MIPEATEDWGVDGGDAVWIEESAEGAESGAAEEGTGTDVVAADTDPYEPSTPAVQEATASMPPTPIPSVQPPKAEEEPGGDSSTIMHHLEVAAGEGAAQAADEEAEAAGREEGGILDAAASHDA